MGFAILYLLPFFALLSLFFLVKTALLFLVQFPLTWCSSHFASYFEIQILHVSTFSNDFRVNSNLQKNEKKKKRGKKRTTNIARTKNEKPMWSSFLHASAILFSFVHVLVHLCVVNSTVNEWSDPVVVCSTSCEVTQTGKFCKHTRMLCEHILAWVRAKSRGFAPVSCVYCKPGLSLCPSPLPCLQQRCLCTSRTMGKSISTIQRSLRINTSYKFAAPRYQLPPMAL